MANQYDFFNLMLAGGYNPMDGGITSQEMENFKLQGLINNNKALNEKINAMNLPPVQEPNPQEELAKRQRRANMLLAIGDAFKGKDIASGVMERQAIFNAQRVEAENKARLKEAFANNPELEQIYNVFGREAAYNYAYGQPKNNQPASVKEYQFAKQQGYTGSYEDFLKSKKATTNINTGISGFQKSAVDAYNNVQKEARDARVINTSLDTLDNLLNKGVDTGFGSGVGLSLQRIGQSIIGEDYKVPEIAGREAFQAETTKLILPLVKQLGVNPTDKDLEFVKTGAIELSKSEAGNRIMIAGLRLSQQRKLDEANFDNQFYNNNPQATIFERNIAFQKHMDANPELYTSDSLQQAYDDLLLNQANNSSVITTDETAPFGN